MVTKALSFYSSHIEIALGNLFMLALRNVKSRCLFKTTGERDLSTFSLIIDKAAK